MQVIVVHVQDSFGHAVLIELGYDMDLGTSLVNVAYCIQLKVYVVMRTGQSKRRITN